MNKKYIVTVCGTSLLTNCVREAATRSLLFRYANVADPEEVPAKDREAIEAVIDAAGNALLDASVSEARVLSAELNSLNLLLIEKKVHPGDFHYLLCTDTWLGEAAAKILKSWIKKNYPESTHVLCRQRDLQTADIDAFQVALSDLVRQFANDIPGYKSSGYEVIFNLTGGFKSVQGFLQSVANFYADEAVYIFESSGDALLRIPRLPVRMDGEAVIRAHLSDFRNIRAGIMRENTSGIAETLLFTIDGKPNLSAWGEMLWVDCFRRIYGEQLLPSPRPEKIVYGQKFSKAAGKLSTDRMVALNERLDQLNRFAADSEFNLNSLDVKPLKTDVAFPSTHELDAWHNGSAWRVYFHYQKSDDGKVIVLDDLNKGFH